MPTLSSLPPEVIEQILLLVDWRSVLYAQQVNTSLNDISRSSKAIQYHVELGVAGMEDGPPYPRVRYPTSERLERLRTYQARWKTVDYVKRQTVRAVKGNIWELATGVLAQGISSDSLGFTTETRKLLFTRLPSVARGDLKTKEWTLSDFEFSIRDFTLDAAQDLLVLLRAGPDQESAEIHFRSLRTGKKHEEAKLPFVTHPLDGGARLYSHLLQVCHERLCILHVGLHDVWPEKMVMYNWKTGVTEFSVEFSGILTYSFITFSHLLIAVHPFNAMPARSGDQQPRLLILDIEKTAALPLDENGYASYVATTEFHLPEMKPYVDILEIVIHCNSPPVRRPNPEDDKAPAFVTSPDNRLFVITLSTSVVLVDAGDHRADEGRTISIFVPFSTFVPFLDNPTPETIPTLKSQHELTVSDYHLRPMRSIAVPWTKWMQHGARALSIPGMDLIWVCNVYGSRFVHAVEPFDAQVPRAARRVAVLDFNQDSLRFDRAQTTREETRRAGSSEPESETGSISDKDSSCAESESSSKSSGHGKTVIEDRMEPSTLEVETCGVFEENVTTYLPYRRTVFPEKVRFDAVMLSEDNIVFVHDHQRRQPKDFEVFTF